VSIPRKCRFNRGLLCPADKCPLRDKTFQGALERWLFLNRTPRSTDLTPSTKVRQFKGPENRLAALADFAVCIVKDEAAV